MQLDSDDLYNYIQHNLKNKYDLKNVFFIGRSLGTGMATYMASKYKCGGLILFSAMTSIRDAAKYCVCCLCGYWG